MTTENTKATAAQQEDTRSTDNSNSVQAAAAQASAANTTDEAIETKIESVLQSRLDQYGQQVQDVEKREQGRAQQWYGDKLKEARGEDREELAGFMSDLTLVLDEEQREQLEELRGQRENQQLQGRIDALEQQLQGGGAQATASAMSQTDAQALYDATQGFIEASGLDITPDNSSLWAGYQNGMSLQEAINVARRNIKTVTAASRTATLPPAEKPAEIPQQRVPLSTARAPTTPADSYDSLGELAIAFRDREINSQDYTRISRERGWL